MHETFEKSSQCCLEHLHLPKSCWLLTVHEEPRIGRYLDSLILHFQFPAMWGKKKRNFFHFQFKRLQNIKLHLSVPKQQHHEEEYLK